MLDKFYNRSDSEVNSIREKFDEIFDNKTTKVLLFFFFVVLGWNKIEQSAWREGKKSGQVQKW